MAGSDRSDAASHLQQAKDIEALGYGAVWVGGSPPAELDWVEPILEATTTLQVATGIVNIWSAAAKPVAESFHRIDKAYPGRFLLGIGVGHPEAISEYRKPYDALVEYLDQLDEYGVPANRRVVAALGPRVLKLSARAQRRSAPLPDHAGAHRAGPRTDRPVGVPGARAQGGADHRSRRRRARSAARRSTIYFNLANYRNNWKRLGFSEDEVTRPGSDRLVDAVVAYGTPGGDRGAAEGAPRRRRRPRACAGPDQR